MFRKLRWNKIFLSGPAFFTFFTCSVHDKGGAGFNTKDIYAMKHILDVTVSYFDTVDTRIPRNGNLLKLLTAGWFKEDVERLRRELDPNRQPELKKKASLLHRVGNFQCCRSRESDKTERIVVS